MKKPRITGARDRPWHMRAWSGITFGGWCRVLARHGFRISPARLPMASMLTGMSVFNSLLSELQRLTHHKKIAATELVGAPIFVVGHWRAGTTLLHELLVADPSFTYPNTYACFSPNHFLISEGWLKGLVSVFLPRRRPMDNMAIGWDLPQEDEWALCNMGLPSPYFKILFPNMPLHDRAYQSLRHLPAAELQQWREKFCWLLKSLTVREAKPIVLKTPVHTFRIAILLDMFPQAKFIHITRNPFTVIPSTMHTWQRMYRYHGLQIPKFEHLEEDVLRTMADMVEIFEQDKQRLSNEQLYQLRYEDLTQDPIAQLEQLYLHFKLPISEQVRKGWLAYAERSANYKTNRYQLTDQQQAAISSRCAAYFEKYRYDAGQQP